jgi:hypothetical protein
VSSLIDPLELAERMRQVVSSGEERRGNIIGSVLLHSTGEWALPIV